MNQIANLKQNTSVNPNVVRSDFKSELSELVANRTSSDSIEGIGRKLTPSLSSDMVDALGPILALPSKDQGEAGELASVQGFCIALDGVPLQIIIEVRNDFLQKKVKGQSLDYRPSPPRFLDVCQAKLYQVVLAAMLAAGPRTTEDAA